VNCHTCIFVEQLHGLRCVRQVHQETAWACALYGYGGCASTDRYRKNWQRQRPALCPPSGAGAAMHRRVQTRSHWRRATATPWTPTACGWENLDPKKSPTIVRTAVCNFRSFSTIIQWWLCSWEALIYRAHRAVILAIAQLSCFMWEGVFMRQISFFFFFFWFGIILESRFLTVWVTVETKIHGFRVTFCFLHKNTKILQLVALSGSHKWNETEIKKQIYQTDATVTVARGGHAYRAESFIF